MGRQDLSGPVPREEPEIARWRVPMRLPSLAGHFPNFPILPGVSQLCELVLPAVEKRFPDLLSLRRLERLKFVRPIYPGDDLELTLERETIGTTVRFRIVRAGEICASGRLLFVATDQAA